MTWIRKKEEYTNPLPTGMFPILLPLSFGPASMHFMGDWFFTTTGAGASGRSTSKNQYW